LLWVGQSVSNLGNAMYRVTLAWTVYDVGGSATDMGLVLAANVAPQLILTLYGGVVGDRFSRRTIILVADTIAAIVTALVAFAMFVGELTVPHLIAAALTLGVVSAFFGPAHFPLLRRILPVEDQQAAMGIYGATGSVVSIVGPLLASLVFAVSDPSVGFAVNAVTFVIAAACTAQLTVADEKAVYTTTVRQEIKDGLSYVVRTTWLRIVILLSLIANVATLAPLQVLLATVATGLGGGGELLGVLTAVQAGTAALFAVMAGKFAGRLPRGATVFTLVIATGLGVAVLGAGSEHRWLVVIAMVIIGFSFTFNVVEMTMIQELVPSQYLSRVYSVNTVASFVLAPIGYAGAGIVASTAGPRVALVCGGLILAFAGLGTALTRRWKLDEDVSCVDDEHVGV
jgi:MFS family permease